MRAFAVAVLLCLSAGVVMAQTSRVPPPTPRPTPQTDPFAGATPYSPPDASGTLPEVRVAAFPNQRQENVPAFGRGSV
jgi:hypothetical protein